MKKTSIENLSKKIEPLDNKTFNKEFKIKKENIILPSKIGWKELSKTFLIEEDDFVKKSYDVKKISKFELFIPKFLYGQTYHNILYLFFGALISWIIGVLELPSIYLIIVIIVFSIFYRFSIKKNKKMIAKKLQKNISRKSIDSDYESINWLNIFMKKIWLVFEPALSKKICDNLNDLLNQVKLPFFISKLWIETFTVGTKPPQINAVRTLSNTKDNISVMDFEVSIVPNCFSNVKSKSLFKNVNQKFILKLKLFGIPISISFSDFFLKIFLRANIKMISEFPHFKNINITLVKFPDFDFKLLFIDNSIFNFDLFLIPFFYNIVNNLFMSQIEMIVLKPMSFNFDFQEIMLGNGINSTIGLLLVEVDFLETVDFTSKSNSDLFFYLSFGIENNKFITTSKKQGSKMFIWKESYYVLVKSLDLLLTIKLICYNNYSLKTEVGTIFYDFNNLIDDENKVKLKKPFINDGQCIGNLNFSLKFHPVIEYNEFNDVNTSNFYDLNTGIVKFIILDFRNLSNNKNSPLYLSIFLNQNKIMMISSDDFNSKSSKNCFEHLIFDRLEITVNFILQNHKKLNIASKIQQLNDLIFMSQNDETKIKFNDLAELKVKAVWKSVHLSNIESTKKFLKPIGALRLKILNFKFFKIILSTQKLEFYARIHVNKLNYQVSKISKINNNVILNEAFYFIILSNICKLKFELIEISSYLSDRYIAEFEFDTFEIIKRSDNGEILEFCDSHVRTLNFISKKGDLCEMKFTTSFYPCDLESDKNSEIKSLSKKDENSNLTRQISNPHDFGILFVEIPEVFSKKSELFIQIFFENNGYPNYVTEKLKKSNNQINFFCNFVIKELNHSFFTFRLTKSKINNKLKKAISESVVNLKEALDSKTEIFVEFKSNDEQICNFNLKLSWYSLKHDNPLPPEDLASNIGVLNITILNFKSQLNFSSEKLNCLYFKLYLNNETHQIMKTDKFKKKLLVYLNKTSSIDLMNKYDSTIIIKLYESNNAFDKDNLLADGCIEMKDLKFNFESYLKVDLKSLNSTLIGCIFLKFFFKSKFILNLKKNNFLSKKFSDKIKI